MNDVFTCIKMHIIWHLMTMTIYQSNNFRYKMHNTTFKIDKEKFNWWRMKLHFSRPLKLCNFTTERGHWLLVFHVDCYCQLLQMVLHYLQWRLMVSWPTGEECQLSPQLHTQAKSQRGLWDQRSPMMWLDPTQSMDTGSQPLATMLLMGCSNRANGNGKYQKKTGCTRGEETCFLEKKKASIIWR